MPKHLGLLRLCPRLLQAPLPLPRSFSCLYPAYSSTGSVSLTRPTTAIWKSRKCRQHTLPATPRIRQETCFLERNRLFSTMASGTLGSAADGRRSVTIVTEAVEKPSLDDRSYRGIKLANQLEALLVHDPKTDKASASLDVGVGNFSDAADIPGLAHAVEHVSVNETGRGDDGLTSSW